MANYYKIDEKFIEDIRLLYGSTRFCFNDELDDKTIVPDNLTHYALFKTFWEIDSSILDFYFNNTSHLFTDEDYQKMLDTGYHGEKNRTLHPFPIKIFGAYFSRCDLYVKLCEVFYSNSKYTAKAENFEDLIPYFKEYSKGFDFGYNNFENDFITPYLLLENDKSDIILRVFTYLYRTPVKWYAGNQRSTWLHKYIIAIMFSVSFTHHALYLKLNPSDFMQSSLKFPSVSNIDIDKL